ncbi:hypothetical protein [Micromonospora sp. DT233]|uniref:hypothetical protein n=1 Tax=Micromonospora sp. DT233 TaxID=3393432 RepID=UPI003CEEB5C5
MTRPAVRSGPLVRFVLLACTLVGLAAMHSLGHDPTMALRADAGHPGQTTVGPAPGHHGRTAAGMDGGHLGRAAVLARSVVLARPAVFIPPVVLALPAGCAGGTCEGQSASAYLGGHGHLPGWQVCLAVLTVLGLAVLLGLLLVTRAGRARTRCWSAPRVGRCRAPPARRLGLHLASVSVLRT